MGVTLGSDVSFDICGIFFGNCGGVTHWRIFAISMNVFTVVCPYVRDGIVGFGACNMAMI